MNSVQEDKPLILKRQRMSFVCDANQDSLSGQTVIKRQYKKVNFIILQVEIPVYTG